MGEWVTPTYTPTYQEIHAFVPDETQEKRRAHDWLESQDDLYTLTNDGKVASSRVWDPTTKPPLFFRSGGRDLSGLVDQGSTLDQEEISAYLLPEVERCANTIIPTILGYPVVGVVGIEDPDPDDPYICVFFPPAAPVGYDPADPGDNVGASVIPPGQAAVWKSYFDIDEEDQRADRIRHYVAREVGRELRRIFGLVTGIRVCVPVCARVGASHEDDGVDFDDGDDESVLTPCSKHDDLYFAAHPAVEMDDGDEAAVDEDDEDGEIEPKSRDEDGEGTKRKRKRDLADIGDEGLRRQKKR